MRVFAFLAALAVVGLVITGAIKLQKSNKTISIEIDRDRVKQDARAVVKKGKEVLREAGSALEQARRTSDQE
jgi:hypothetical protein